MRFAYPGMTRCGCWGEFSNIVVVARAGMVDCASLIHPTGAVSPSDRCDHRPGCIALLDGGPGTRDGPAWVGVADCSALPAVRRNAASRVPSAASGRRHARRKVFHSPGAGHVAGGVQAGPLFDGRSLDISPLGAKLSRAFPGAEGLVHPPRSLRIAPAPLNSHAQPPSLPKRWRQYPPGIRGVG